MKFLHILLIILITASTVDAQRWKLRRYEVGLNLGSTQVFGDIGGTASEKNWFGLKDLRLDETQPAIGIHVRYKVDQIYSVKFLTCFGMGKGADDYSRNDHRGFSYKTKIIENSFQVEYYLISEEKRYKSAAMFNRRGMLNNYSTVSLYTFLGLGATMFFPNTEAHVRINQDDGTVYDQIDGYGFISISVPLGLGAKYIIDDSWLIGAEVGYRWTTSDFLDGYKQLVNSKYNDVYYFMLFSVSHRLKTSRRGIPVFLDKGYRRARSRSVF